jgi:hypothetical protein
MTAAPTSNARKMTIPTVSSRFSTLAVPGGSASVVPSPISGVAGGRPKRFHRGVTPLPALLVVTRVKPMPCPYSRTHDRSGIRSVSRQRHEDEVPNGNDRAVFPVVERLSPHPLVERDRFHVVWASGCSRVPRPIRDLLGPLTLTRVPCSPHRQRVWQSYPTLVQFRPASLAAYKARSARRRMELRSSSGRTSVIPALKV